MAEGRAGQGKEEDEVGASGLSDFAFWLPLPGPEPGHTSSAG